MEQVLEVYKRPHDERFPVICMDETTKQCVKETRAPQPVGPNRPARYDAEYERNGVAHLLLYYAPLENWRRVDVASDHVATTWAEGVRQLVETDFPDAHRITLVMDNLNTHAGASLYKAFPAATGAPVAGETGVRLHAQAWQLAEHGRMRIQRAGPPVPGPAPSRHRYRGGASGRLGETPQRPGRARRMAIHHRGRADQIAQPLSKNIRLKRYYCGIAEHQRRRRP